MCLQLPGDLMINIFNMTQITFFVLNYLYWILILFSYIINNFLLGLVLYYSKKNVSLFNVLILKGIGQCIV